MLSVWSIHIYILLDWQRKRHLKRLVVECVFLHCYHLLIYIPLTYQNYFLSGLQVWNHASREKNLYLCYHRKQGRRSSRINCHDQLLLLKLKQERMRLYSHSPRRFMDSTAEEQAICKTPRAIAHWRLPCQKHWGVALALELNPEEQQQQNVQGVIRFP